MTCILSRSDLLQDRGLHLTKIHEIDFQFISSRCGIQMRRGKRAVSQIWNSTGLSLDIFSGKSFTRLLRIASVARYRRKRVIEMLVSMNITGKAYAGETVLKFRVQHPGTWAFLSPK